MLQYVCDSCGAVKGPSEDWILGFAAEQLGVKTARREIALAPAWDDNKAVQWFAVHFCSDECADDYVAKLFGESMPKKVVEKVSVRPGATRRTKVAVSRSPRGTRQMKTVRKSTVRRRRTT